MIAQKQPVTSDVETVMETSKARRRWRWKPRVWVQWLHRWVTLTLGLILLVVTTSGSLALFRFELNKLTYAHLYHVTPGAPVSLDQAREAVRQALASDSSMQDVRVADLITRPGDVYQFYLRDADDHTIGSAFVDPGAGVYLGHYNSEETLWGWIAKLHYTLFSDEIEFPYPEGTPEWLTTWFGPNLAEFTLKNMGVLLMLMVLSGAYLWWPGIKKFAYGFRVRRGAQGFNWHYDWHKVLGFVSLPFLFMWALTGMGFYQPWSDWIKSGWHAATFSPIPVDAPEVFSTQQERPMLSAEEIRQAALTAVPDSRFISVSMPETITGTADIWLAHGLDSYAYGEWPGNINVRLDVYSGAVLDNSMSRDGSVGAYLYNNWFYPVHFGYPLPWYGRLIWFLFGMMPLFLAFTGVMQWWMKRQKRRARTLRRAAVAGAAGD